MVDIAASFAWTLDPTENDGAGKARLWHLLSAKPAFLLLLNFPNLTVLLPSPMFPLNGKRLLFTRPSRQVSWLAGRRVPVSPSGRGRTPLAVRREDDFLLGIWPDCEDLPPIPRFTNVAISLPTQTLIRCSKSGELSQNIARLLLDFRPDTSVCGAT